jgi:hypothetical protein
MYRSQSCYAYFYDGMTVFTSYLDSDLDHDLTPPSACPLTTNLTYIPRMRKPDRITWISVLTG